MNILYSEHNAPTYIRPPVLGPAQVICGPEYPDQSAAGRIVSLKTPRGQYDIAAVAARLPRSQKPELVIVRGDNTMQNVPRNLGALSCRKVLVVGDTHHRPAPIRRLIQYALAEPFDAVIVDYTRQHAHYFLEAGLSSVYWLPGFNVDRTALPAGIEQDIPFSFVGSVGKRHPRRGFLLGSLKTAGLPIRAMKAPASGVRHVHARSRISLNPSLNGDLNLRIFEVLASGSLLLTDKLSPEAGLDLLLENGRHAVFYDGVEDCIARARGLVADPDLVDRIAAAGHAHYEESLAPERIHADFFAIVEHGRVRPEFGLGSEARCRRGKVGDFKQFMQRIGRYELLQELHRLIERPTVLATASVDGLLLADALDLPRLRLAVDVREAPERERILRHELAAAGMESRCEWLGREAQLADSRWDLLLMTMADWRSGRARELSSRRTAALLFVTDLVEEPAAATELEAAGLQRVNDKLPLFAWSRAKAA